MNMHARLVMSAAATAISVGCATAPAPADLPAPSLAGHWLFEVDTGKAKTLGAMQLIAQGTYYQGTLTTNQGTNVLPIRRLTVQARAIVMTVESPNGEVVFRGALDADDRSFSGTVTYFNGQVFPMTGRRS
ncbi:MAG: hypothetical protein HUU30_04265 [Burkholderiaceae bacterium]|nr:hypothetical protein [Aquabacterium sp.]NUP84954.1 hypothetical protein [Burkholderiaceae bacterium]